MVRQSVYGECHNCKVEFSIPGYDHSYCLKCGWVAHFKEAEKGLGQKKTKNRVFGASKQKQGDDTLLLFDSNRLRGVDSNH